MADENPSVTPVQSGLLDPLIGAGFFSPNMSLEEIKRRRAIAAALASRSRGYPKTIGEGMTYFGESLAEAMQDRKLDAAEKAYSAKRESDFPGAAGTGPATIAPRPVADVPPEVLPPPELTASVAPPPAAAGRPSPLPPAPAGPLTVEPQSGPASRQAIAQALERQRIGRLNAETGTVGGAPAPNPTQAAVTTGSPPPVSPSVGGTGAVSGPDGSETVFEGGPNPPVVNNTIRPMMVADATGARPGGIGTVPGVFDRRAPERPVPAEKPDDPLIEPKLAPETLQEQKLKAYQRAYRNDPVAVQNAQQAIDTLAGERQRDWTIKHEKWKIDYADKLKQEDPKYRVELDEAKKKAQREADEYTTFPFGKARHEQMAKESAEIVKGVPAASTAIANVRGLLGSDAGMFTGSDANVSQGLSKLAIALNLPYDPKTRDKVENTEAFKGFMVPILAALRPAVVGTGAQTAPELKLLQDAAAGNITLERGSIEKIIGAVEHLNAVAAVQHHKRLIASAGGNENARQVLFGQYELPLEDILPRGKVNLLRREIESKRGDEAAIRAEMEEFDRTYFTPGLAQRVLGKR